jgi:hypothetical protein
VIVTDRAAEDVNELARFAIRKSGSAKRESPVSGAERVVAIDDGVEDSRRGWNGCVLRFGIADRRVALSASR